MTEFTSEAFVRTNDLTIKHFISQFVGDCDWCRCLSELDIEAEDCSSETIERVWLQELPQNGAALDSWLVEGVAVKVNALMKLERTLGKSENLPFRVVSDKVSHFVVLKDAVVAYYSPSLSLVPVKRTEADDLERSLSAMLERSNDPYVNPEIVVAERGMDPSRRSEMHGLIQAVLESSVDPLARKVRIRVTHGIRDDLYTRPTSKREIDRTVPRYTSELSNGAWKPAERDANLLNAIVKTFEPVGHEAFFSNICNNRKDNLQHLGQLTFITLDNAYYEADINGPALARERLRHWIAREQLDAAALDV